MLFAVQLIIQNLCFAAYYGKQYFLTKLKWRWAIENGWISFMKFKKVFREMVKLDRESRFAPNILTFIQLLLCRSRHVQS